MHADDASSWNTPLSDQRLPGYIADGVVRAGRAAEPVQGIAGPAACAATSSKKRMARPRHWVGVDCAQCRQLKALYKYSACRISFGLGGADTRHGQQALHAQRSKGSSEERSRVRKAPLALHVRQDLGARRARVLWDALPGRLTFASPSRVHVVGHHRL